MKQSVTILVLLLCFTISISIPSPVFAADSSAFVPQMHPNLEIRPLVGSISIDGDISDDGWQNAARADNFSEVSPGDQVKPPVESAALVTYDESNLYVALVAWDDPGSVRVSLRDRDEIFRDDYFGVMIDTYGDYASAYEIFVNPIGIQGDLKIMANGNEDGTFDMVFESEGMVTDSGYQVELAIPFSSLRFPDKENQTWRLNFWRDHQRDVRRRYAWSAQDRDDPCWHCQWGTATGIKNIKPGSNLDIIPNVIASQSSSLNGDPSSGLENGDPDGDVSFNARYGITSNSSVELAVNPDFSQVESDADQVDVNTTFGLYFQERRPFFQEGSDLFDSRINAVYTRSINNPLVAGKFTGQFGRTSVAYLLAYDEDSPLLIPLEELSITELVGESISNVLRVRRSFQRDSYVGLILTDRRYSDYSFYGQDQEGGSGTVYGFDGTYRFVENFRLGYQLLGSRVEEGNAPGLSDSLLGRGYPSLFNRDRNTVMLDGETLAGQAISTGLDYNGRHLYSELSYNEQSPAFRASNGFVTTAGRRQVNYYNGLSFSPNRKYLIEWQPSLSFGRVWNHDGKFRDEWVVPELHFEFHGRTGLSIEYMHSRERFRDILFADINEISFALSNDASEYVGGGIEYSKGRRIYRRSPEMANNEEVYLWMTLRPTQRLVIDPSLVHLSIKDRGDGSTIVEGQIFRSRLDYQFTRELFLRFVLQYNTFDDEVDIEPLLTYRVNPFTVFYLGMTGRYQKFDHLDYSGLNDSAWKLSDRQIFAKFQYLFRV
ncbi:MAG: DUF5916 domain-containing protein [bacterium]|nr:DUF5916 domain-containing protein [bacterium]